MSAMAPAQKPNILMVLCDDLAAWMLGTYGNREIKTPNIDRLARTGTKFASAFVCTPVCSPSRATLFTGRTPMQHGIEDFLTSKPVQKPPQGQEAPPKSFANEVMISDMLSQAGYNCGYIGKWHMGGDEKPGHGYSFTYTMLSGVYQDPKMSLNGEVRQEKGYLTDLMTERACEFIGRQEAGKPFFLTVSYFNPHVPLDGHPQKYYDTYANTKFDSFGYEPAAPNALREKELLQDTVGNLRKTAASTTALDDQIPVLLRKLSEKGFRENTLIIFTGDNGFLLGRHGLWSKGHASDPINMYEEVIQVPMVWVWPGVIPVEGNRPELVSFYDVLPTVCEVAGVPAPQKNLCGRSFWPLLINKPSPQTEPWKDMVFAHFRNTEMVRDRRYKLVIRNGGEGPNEFYDLRKDPRERVNEWENAGYDNMRDRLRIALEGWRKNYSGA
jgi:arylsulfatase A-like enzyme